MSKNVVIYNSKFGIFLKEGETYVLAGPFSSGKSLVLNKFVLQNLSDTNLIHFLSDYQLLEQINTSLNRKKPLNYSNLCTFVNCKNLVEGYSFIQILKSKSFEGRQIFAVDLEDIELKVDLQKIAKATKENSVITLLTWQTSYGQNLGFSGYEKLMDINEKLSLYRIKLEDEKSEVSTESAS